MSFSAFGRLRTIPTPVLTLPDDTIYFISTGGVDGNIYPVSFQEEEREKQAQITMLLFQSSRNLAKDRSITPEVALDQMMARDGEVINPLSYLDDAAGKTYLRLVSENAKLKQEMVGNLIRHRIAFHVSVSQACKAKSKQLFIKYPWFLEMEIRAIEVGRCIKFPDFNVQVTEPYDPESESIGVTAIAGTLEAGAIGFLLKADNKTYAMGDPTWTSEETQSLTLVNADGSKSQIDQIYDFYLKESGKLSELEPEAEGNEALTNEKKGFESGSDQNQLTGTNSIGASNLVDVETNGSTLKTLETALVG